MATALADGKTKNPRPLGIWLVTIYSAVLMGVNPAVVNLRYYFGSPEEHALVSPTRLMVSIVLGVVLIALSVGTWIGSSKMRYGLILAVLLQSGVRLYQNILLAEQAANNEQQSSRILGRIVSTVAIAVIVVAYLFLNRHANRFLVGGLNRVPEHD